MGEQKKKKSVWKIVLVAVVVLLVIGAIGSQAKDGGDGGKAQQPQQAQQTAKQDEAKQEAPKQDAAEKDAAKQQPSGLEHGELIDETRNDGVIVIKAKISPSATNKATIDQNYYNVEDYIKSHDMEGVTEVQYWAVADMTNGKEEKVVSFTVPAALIPRIQAGSVPANQLGDYVDELWVHQSLRS